MRGGVGRIVADDDDVVPVTSSALCSVVFGATFKLCAADIGNNSLSGRYTFRRRGIATPAGTDSSFVRPSGSIQ